MTDLCGEPHPDLDDVFCDKETPCYYFHASVLLGGLAWGTCPEPPKKVIQGGKARLDKMAADSKPEELRGPAVLKKMRPPNRSEYENQIKDPAWVEDARRTFHEFLLVRTEPFTTPEHLWPLLTEPSEMRQMVHVVSRALRDRWITEVAAKRLNGVYTTADGHEFKMNKLVPVYQSCLLQVLSGS